MHTSWPTSCLTAKVRLFCLGLLQIAEKYASQRSCILGSLSTCRSDFWLWPVLPQCSFTFKSKNLTVTMCILQEALSLKKGISTAPLRSSMYLLHKHPQKKTKNGAKHILMTFLELNQNGGTCWQDSLETLFAAGQQGLEPNTFTGWVCDVPLLFNRFYPFPSFSRMITPEVCRRFGRFRYVSMKLAIFAEILNSVVPGQMRKP